MSTSTPPKSVVDTNIFISGAILKRGNPYGVLQAWQQGRFLLVTSSDLYDEVAEVLQRPRIKQTYHLTDEEIAQTLSLLREIGIPADPVPELPFELRDPKDEIVLALALGAPANYLVTGDDDLLSLRDDARLGALEIVTPRAFLQILS